MTTLILQFNFAFIKLRTYTLSPCLYHYEELDGYDDHDDQHAAVENLADDENVVMKHSLKSA